MLAYRILCGVSGGAMLLVGLSAFFGFFVYQGPGSPGAGPLPIGPGGAYYLGALGCAMVAWGGALIGAARKPTAAPWIGTVTALGLVMSGLYRMVAWLVGDYAYLGEVLRVEAALFLLLALAFVWLRPTAADARAPLQTRAEAHAT